MIRGGVIKNDIEYVDHFGLKLSSRNLTPELAIKFVDAIDKYKTPILHVYPSSLFVLSKIMLDYGIPRPKHRFEAIFFGSEALYKSQVDVIEHVFNEPRCFWYGSSEKVILAGNCPHNDQYHLYPQYGITEVVTSSGNQCHVGELGELIGTSFWSYETPFIRYKTGDFAVPTDSYCGHCDSNGPLLKSIEGRIQEFAVSSKGTLLSMTYVAGNIHDDIFETVKQFRFEQREQGIVTILFISKHEHKTETKQLLDKLSKVFGADYQLFARSVSSIPISEQGKSTFINQYLDIKKYL
jgi:phenylacetate-CoA ligase